MLVRFESKIQQRGKLQHASEQKIVWAWLSLAFALLLLWLTYHYLVRPPWIRLLPTFVSELLQLMEIATAITLLIITALFWWRQHRQKQDFSASSHRISPSSP